jgi:hypothetical protein
MTHQTPTSLRELDSRTNDGVQVSLLWSEHDGQLWVSVDDSKTNDSFSLEVRSGEKPFEVFHHPYAYAAYRRRLCRVGVSSHKPIRFDDRGCLVNG